MAERRASWLQPLGWVLAAVGFGFGAWRYAATPSEVFEQGVGAYLQVLFWVVAVGGSGLALAGWARAHGGAPRLSASDEAGAGKPAAAATGLRGFRLGTLLSAFGPFLGLVFVYVLFLVHTEKMGVDSFRSVYNSKTILTQAVIYGIGALGMTVVIISGGIDLSAGSVVALGTVVTALILREFGGENPGLWLPLLAAVAAVAACGFCGFLNGVMISVFRIVPFIVTLGMMQIARGVAKGLAGSTMVNTPRNWLRGLMDVEPSPGVWFSCAPSVWVMLFLLVAMFVVLRYTVFGRYVFAIGSNEATARLCGIHVGWQRVSIYTLCGGLVGVASVMQFSNLTQGDPTAGIAMELDIIAAVVIGGGSLSGGQGSVVGSIVGALIIAVLRNGCYLVGIENYVQNIVIGAIIIAAVGVDRLKHRNA